MPTPESIQQDLDNKFETALPGLESFQTSEYNQKGKFSKVDLLSSRLINIPANLDAAAEVHTYYNPNTKERGYVTYLRFTHNGKTYFKANDHGAEGWGSPWREEDDDNI